MTEAPGLLAAAARHVDHGGELVLRAVRGAAVALRFCIQRQGGKGGCYGVWKRAVRYIPYAIWVFLSDFLGSRVIVRYDGYLTYVAYMYQKLCLVTPWQGLGPSLHHLWSGKFHIVKPHGLVRGGGIFHHLQLLLGTCDCCEASVCDS